MESQALKLKPRETRGDRTRARLVEAALAEFHRHGFERASVARIAEQAGVSRPTFYFHFPAKEDLLRELQAGLQASLAQRIAHSRSLRDALDVFVNGILGVLREVGAPLFAEMLRGRRMRRLPCAMRWPPGSCRAPPSCATGWTRSAPPSSTCPASSAI
jgi:AcrR family transcriptional regulator